jgi:putative integral membrane protein (TIGR02587 family)
MGSKKQGQNAWKKEIDDLIRGACGGFLFGIPLLYTMEVWWIGSSVTPLIMVVALVLTFIIVFLLNKTEGFRKSSQNGRPYEAVTDTVEAMAIGIVCSTLILIVLREITFETALREAVGKIVFESVPFTLGVALANKLLQGTRTSQSNSESSERKPRQRQKNGELNETLSDIGATSIGATFIAFSIAPTDEVPMLAAAVSPPWLLATLVASLLISYGIVFAADFSDRKKRRQQRGIFQRPWSETIFAYLVSLVAAAMMLLFFQQLTFNDPWTMWLDHALILGLPATIGGAAGRLAV